MTTLHSRSAWGARPPKTSPSTINSEGVTAHYGGDSPWGAADRSSAARFRDTTDHNRCASIVRAWQAFHMDGRGWNDIAYNACVCPHGHRYDCRGPGRRSGANGTNTGNARSEAVCYIAGGSDPITDEAKHAFHDEAARFGRGLRWNHSNWKSTSCAGSAIKAWQSTGWPRPANDEGELDMGAVEELKGFIEERHWLTTAEVDTVEERLEVLGEMYRHTYEMWANLIDGKVGTPENPVNGTPAYVVRRDMLEDVLNVPSMTRTLERKVDQQARVLAAILDHLGVTAPSGD